MKWHKLTLECPQCKNEPTLLHFSVAADGEVLLEMICVKCATRLAWKSDIVNLVRGAIVQDIQESNIRHKPIRPPMADPCEKMADNSFLHSLGIDPNEPKQLGGIQ